MRTLLRTATAFLIGALLTALVFAFHPEPGEAIRNIAHPPPAEPPRPDLYNIVRVKQDDGGFDHFLGPHVSMDSKWTAGIAYPIAQPPVRLLVDTQGKVAYAEARSGPKEMRREAERLVRQVRFSPFQRNGKPVRAVIEEFNLRVRGEPEEWSKDRVPFPPVKDWGTLRIETQLGGYYGGFSRLTIDGAGRVTFESNAATVRGKHVATISKSELEELVDTFRRADWFSMLDLYDPRATHQDMAMTSIQFDGRHKPVLYSPSPFGNQPDTLRDVHAAVRRITNVDRWLKGNDATGPSLVAEKWNFKAKSPENFWLLTGIAQSGSFAALRDVWALGAPVITQTAPYPAPEPPIIAAAERQETEILHFLLSLRVRWDQRSLNAALLKAADKGHADAVSRLLSKGADPRAATRLDGASVLMVAAKSGSRETVAALITHAASRDGWSYESLFGEHAGDYWPKRDAKEKTRIAEAARLFVTTPGRDGVTALHAAANASTWDKLDADPRGVVRLLIKHGAVVDARDKNGRTPLIEAGIEPNAASELINAGANVNAQDNNGETPLMNSYVPWLTRLLLERGADIHARNKEGRSALDLSKEYGSNRDTTPVLEWWLAKEKAPR